MLEYKTDLEGLKTFQKLSVKMAHSDLYSESAISHEREVVCAGELKAE